MVLGALLSVAVFTFVVFMGIAIWNKKAQENVYVAAMEEFREAINADKTDIDKITELANQVKSDGYYAYIEQAAKCYIYDTFVPYFSAIELQENGLFKDGVTATLIEAERPDFGNSLTSIAKMKEYANLISKAANTIFSREDALDYLESGLSDYYIALFDEQVEEIYNNPELKQNYLNYAAAMQQKSDAYVEVINFLKANKNYWHIQNDTISFKTTALTNQYNQLLAKIGQK